MSVHADTVDSKKEVLDKIVYDLMPTEQHYNYIGC